jgi:hypothetical protein
MGRTERCILRIREEETKKRAASSNLGENERHVLSTNSGRWRGRWTGESHTGAGEVAAECVHVRVPVSRGQWINMDYGNNKLEKPQQGAL